MTVATTQRFDDCLGRLEFRRWRNGYRHEHTIAHLNGGWLTLRAKAREQADPNDLLPGLWKPSVNARGDALLQFDVPLEIFDLADPDLALEDDRDPAEPAFEATVAWALDALNGRVAADWQAAIETVQASTAEDSLTLRDGGFVRQGSILREPGRLAVRFPLCGSLDPALSAARRDLLKRLLDRSQSQWRMVRVRRGSSPGDPAAAVEVDFSGAPQSILPPLFERGLAAARGVASQLLWHVGFVADPQVQCELWEQADSCGDPPALLKGEPSDER